MLLMIRCQWQPAEEFERGGIRYTRPAWDGHRRKVAAGGCGRQPFVVDEELGGESSEPSEGDDQPGKPNESRLQN
jgi:hypothetical protein